MNQRIGTLEVVIFKGKEGLSSEAVKQELESLSKIVSEFQGFISRTLSQAPDGEWMDLVLWESLEQAEAAGKQVMENPEALKVFGVIDESSMKFKHYVPQLITEHQLANL